MLATPSQLYVRPATYLYCKSGHKTIDRKVITLVGEHITTILLNGYSIKLLSKYLSFYT